MLANNSVLPDPRGPRATTWKVGTPWSMELGASGRGCRLDRTMPIVTSTAAMINMTTTPMVPHSALMELVHDACRAQFRPLRNSRASEPAAFGEWRDRASGA
jgi:hypothetical protein